MEGANCGLHPLIHTFLEFALIQDVDVLAYLIKAPSTPTGAIPFMVARATRKTTLYPSDSLRFGVVKRVLLLL